VETMNDNGGTTEGTSEDAEDRQL
jgi:hypothetical protein